jgi:hypothetical protein
VRREVPIADEDVLIERRSTPNSPEPIPIPDPTPVPVAGPSSDRPRLYPRGESEEIEEFFARFGGSPALSAFNRGEWSDYVKEIRKSEKGKGKETDCDEDEIVDKAEEKISADLSCPSLQ